MIKPIIVGPADADNSLDIPIPRIISDPVPVVEGRSRNAAEKQHKSPPQVAHLFAPIVAKPIITTPRRGTVAPPALPIVKFELQSTSSRPSSRYSRKRNRRGSARQKTAEELYAEEMERKEMHLPYWERKAYRAYKEIKVLQPKLETPI